VIDEPRYLIESRAARDGNSFQPVFVSSLTQVSSPIWSGSIWAVPPDVELRRGAFVFTTTGAWAGLVSEHDGRTAIVPGELVLRMADQLLGEGLVAHGLVGIQVQSMDPGVAAATGTSSGVMVTWVDRDGPAWGRVSATDVIETVDGEPVVSAEHWRSRIDRIRAGQTFALRVRRGSAVRTVQITAAGVQNPGGDRVLGLLLRTIPRVGVEVVGVVPSSAGSRAGIQPGDIVTVIGGIDAPSPEEVTGAFAAATPDRPVLAAITRGQTHHVLALNK
jgi:S1-C subfamily serine protease